MVNAASPILSELIDANSSRYTKLRCKSKLQ